MLWKSIGRKWKFCRYLWQHRYNLTLSDLIDKIDSPIIKTSMEGWAYRDLEDWPNPQQYLYMLATGDRLVTMSTKPCIDEIFI